MRFLAIFSILLNCGGFCIGHTLSGTNQTSSILKSHFPEYAADPTFYDTLVGSAGIAGMTIGAIFGGRVVQLGRRKSYIIATSIGILGVCLTLIENIYSIITGRFLFGLSSGIYSGTIPRFIEETVPPHLIVTFSPLFVWSQGIG